ncbi:MAG: hypothetical protein JWM34_1908 [Ilumatobacteraceae bacterium]|nr:hypothetical protein [Ilumatobacteraceae bacterium]
MCLRCDGYTEQQIIGMTEMHIRVFGWSVAAVEEARPWTYSIGLLENFGHPELVVTDMEIGLAKVLINEVATVVKDGVDPRARHELQSMGVELVVVDERHLRTRLFNSWTRYYGEPPHAGDFVQILPPPEMFCACHRDTYRRLDRI